MTPTTKLTFYGVNVLTMANCFHPRRPQIYLFRPYKSCLIAISLIYTVSLIVVKSQPIHERNLYNKFNRCSKCLRLMLDNGTSIEIWSTASKTTATKPVIVMSLIVPFCINIAHIYVIVIYASCSKATSLIYTVS